RGAGRDQPFELAPQLEQHELLLDVDFGDARAVPTDDIDEMVRLETLQRLAHRRPAYADLPAELRLRPDTAGRQIERYDHLLQHQPGAGGQPQLLRARRKVRSGLSASTIACRHVASETSVRA